MEILEGLGELNGRSAQELSKREKIDAFKKLPPYGESPADFFFHTKEFANFFHRWDVIPMLKDDNARKMASKITQAYALYQTLITNGALLEKLDGNSGLNFMHTKMTQIFINGKSLKTHHARTLAERLDMNLQWPEIRDRIKTLQVPDSTINTVANILQKSINLAIKGGRPADLESGGYF